MSEPVRIRIRCSKEAKKVWGKAHYEFDLKYGKLALYGAKFLLANKSDFRKFIHEKERERPKRDGR